MGILAVVVRDEPRFDLAGDDLIVCPVTCWLYVGYIKRTREAGGFTQQSARRAAIGSGLAAATPETMPSSLPEV